MIFAIDFDGTIVEHLYPEIGALKPGAIDALKFLQENGHKIILWTFRKDRPLREAVWFLKEHGIVCDAVNEDVPEIVGNWGNTTGKVYADYYLDDRSMPPFCGWEKFMICMINMEPKI